MEQSPAPRRLSYNLALYILVASTLVAYLSTRISLSPSTLVLLSPLLLVGGVLGWIAIDLYVTWWVEQLVKRRLQQLLGNSGSEGGSGGGWRSAVRTHRGVPPLSFTSSAAWSVTLTRASWEAHTTAFRFHFPSAPPALSSALDHLFDLIMRDFVLKWFTAISDSPTFPNAVEQTIRESIATLATRVGEVDWSDVIVGRILPLVTEHVDSFRAAEVALRGQDLRTQLTESDELDLFLASSYASETKTGRLHASVDVASPNSRPAEEAWLRGVVGRLLPLIMPAREVESGAVRIMAREIVSCAVLLPIIELLSDPDFWNRIIDEKAGAAIRDQKMVTQFREALDKQGSTLSPTTIGNSTTIKRACRTEEISATTDPKQFEAWVRGIGRTSSLLDVRRLRSDVTGQIRKTTALIDGRAKDQIVDGQKVSDLIEYIDRLDIARRKVDKRIEELGGNDLSLSQSDAVDPTTRRHHSRVTLRDILTHPSSLSYFMEYQDRRRRSLRVQFWLLVEGLKDPLEDIESDIDGSADLTLPTPDAVSTAMEDMTLIWDTYLSTNVLNSNHKYVKVVRAFIEGGTANVNTMDLHKVRRAVFAAQQDVLSEMEEEDYPGFSKSDLYYKAMADLPDTTSADTISPYASVSTLPPLSPRPPIIRSNPPTPPLRQLSTFASAVTPSAGSSHSPQLKRTDTAPPQLTFQAVFDQQRPVMRRQLSDATSPPSTPTFSTLALEHSNNSAKSATKVSNSLEFLMSSPDPGAAASFERSPLFDEVSPGGRRSSATIEAATSHSDDDYVQVQTIEAIQEALNSILATDARGGNTPETRSTIAGTPLSLSSSQELTSRSFSNFTEVRKPVHLEKGVKKRRAGKRVFDDDEDMSDLEPEDLEPEFDLNSIRFASPGDLQLPVEIAKLATTIEKLRNQEAVVGALIRKAELTGIASELKILFKSRESLRREMRALEFQKRQWESQESENKLVPGRTTVTISGTTVGQADGQSFQLYLVEVHQLALDGTYASGWIVTRRYSEFANLHLNLKEKFYPARQLDFPGKRLVTSYNENFIEQRKSELEKYLQALVLIPVVCSSNELRSFLSQQNISLPKFDLDPNKRNISIFPGQSLVRSFYRSVTSGIDDMFNTGPLSMMDTIIQRLSQQAADLSGIGGPGVQDEDLVGQLLAGKGPATLPLDLGGGEEGLTYFTAPICELFVTLFELKEKNNWLRRQAILIILQQVLGGTIERKFRDAAKALLSPDQLLGYINILTSSLWPGGELKPKSVPRTLAEKIGTRDSANRKLSALMPDVAANLIGRANARQGARRLFAVLQNRRLNRHLLYSVVDDVISVLFPDLPDPPPQF